MSDDKKRGDADDDISSYQMLVRSLPFRLVRLVAYDEREAVVAQGHGVVGDYIVGLTQEVVALELQTQAVPSDGALVGEG